MMRNEDSKWPVVLDALTDSIPNLQRTNRQIFRKTQILTMLLNIKSIQ